MALIRDPIYYHFSKGFRGLPSIGIMEKEMETTMWGLGFRVHGRCCTLQLCPRFSNPS